MRGGRRRRRAWRGVESTHDISSTALVGSAAALSPSDIVTYAAPAQSSMSCSSQDSSARSAKTKSLDRKSSGPKRGDTEAAGRAGELSLSEKQNKRLARVSSRCVLYINVVLHRRGGEADVLVRAHGTRRGLKRLGGHQAELL